MPPKILLTCFFIWFSSLGIPTLNGQASANIFYHLNMDDGLSRNQVTDILQDKDGFIWIGTYYGLNRYDGYSFVPFYHDPEDSTSLSSNDISVLYIDRSGKLWIGTSNAGLNLYDEKNNQFIRLLPFINGINAITENEEGQLWIASSSQGLFFVNPVQPDEYVQYSPEMNDIDRSLKESSLNAVLRTNGNEVWVGGSNMGIDIVNPTEESLLFKEKYSPLMQTKDDNSIFVSSLHQSRDQKIWIGTTQGLFCWDPTKNDPAKKFRSFYPLRGYKDSPLEINISLLDYILDIKEDSKGNIWLSTPIGLVYLKLPDENYSYYLPEKSYSHALAGMGCRSLFVDNAQVLWVGTDNGVSLLHPNAFNFDQGLEQKISPPGISPSEIWQIIPHDRHYYLSSTEGLFRVTENDHGFQYENIIDTNFTALFHTQEGELYAGTVAKADFYRINSQDLSSIAIPKTHQAQDSLHLLGNTILGFVEDEAGMIWISAMGGLNRYDPARGVFRSYEHLPLNEDQSIYLGAVNDLLIDRKKHLWIITSYGLVLLPDNETQKPFGDSLAFIGLTTQPGEKGSLSTNALQTVFESNDGTIWIGTNLGLNSATFDGESIVIERHYLRKEGVEPSIMSMLEDDSGNLWIGTSNAGLFKYDVENKQAWNFRGRDGIFSDSFKFNNCFRNKDGKLVFINEKKMLSFFPDSILQKSIAPKIYLTDLILSNKKSTQRIHQFLHKPLQENDVLTVEPHQRMIQIQFAALDFLNPDKTTYAYRLNGSGGDYVQLGHQREITFVNLAPKTYQLEILAWNSQELVTEIPLKLTLKVKPHIYQTKAAYIFYLLVAAGFIYGIFLFQLKRKDVYRLKKLNELKNRFITNITHQFKTPLTIIGGQTDQIIKKSDKLSKSNILLKAEIIKGQGKHLKDLILQFLDLKELDVGLKKVKLLNGEIITFIKSQVLQHHSLADSKNIRINFQGAEKSIKAAFDPELLGLVFNNLLTNAIKFTSEGGEIKIHIALQKENLKIVVQDNGMGIPKDELALIFDMFYRPKATERAQIPGTGIGLALVKEITELLQGKIKVESKVNEGSIFTLILPLLPVHPDLDEVGIKSDYSKTKPYESQIPQKKDHSNLTGKPLVLLIEDHPEMQRYLTDCLADDFQTIQALNGDKGKEMAIENQPDIIICDVMMPGKSGIEVCFDLKRHDATKHIPIILLTAKADLTTEKEGILSGADLYLGKPFDEERLIFWINNILQRQKQISDVFSSPSWIAKNWSVPNQLAPNDEEFLEDILSYIQQNIHDPDLSIPKLAKAMNKGERTLHRDFKALTGQSIKSFILNMRMQMARKLLISSKLTIEQISMEVGYNSLSAFSRAFKKKCEVSPAKFRGKES